jgi:hypothetical protein
MQPAGSASMALDRFEDSFLRPAPCSTFSCSWHISFPLLVIRGSTRDYFDLLAAADAQPRSKSKK